MVISMTVFTVLSMIVLVGAVVYAIVRRNELVRTLTPIRVVMIGVFAAAFLFVLPQFFYCNELAIGKGRLWMTVVMAVHQSIRIFLADGEMGEILNDMLAAFDGVAGAAVLVPMCKWYYSFLCVAAPISVAGVALAFVDEIRLWVKLFMIGGRHVYAFNELSKRTLVTAQSLKEKHPDLKPLIFFTDVFSKNEETQYELIKQAKEQGAFCCKRDIALLDRSLRRRRRFTRHPASIEYFLLCLDNGENVSHAIKIAENKSAGCPVAPRVYVEAVGEANGAILDSLNSFKVNLAAAEATDKKLAAGDESVTAEERENHRRVKEAEAKLPACALAPQGYSREEFTHASMECLSIVDELTAMAVRRIQPMQRLAWKTLLDAQLHKNVREERGKKIISLLLVGAGLHGVEFLKAAIWLYQLPDVHLEVNVVDRNPNIRDLVEGECPDLMAGSDLRNKGESQYSIRFFGGVDVMGQGFWKAVEEPSEIRRTKEYERIARTTAVIVALGNDDRDIETAMHLRSMFDRLTTTVIKKPIPFEEERVQIYSIVYTECKAENLSRELSNRNGTPYNIKFIGSVKDVYDYDTLTDRDATERESYKMHVRWVYNSRNDRDTMMWYSPLAELFKYANFEYFRIASMAQELHRRLFNSKSYPEYFGDEQYAPGDVEFRNEKGRIIEHRRWNAFMRAQGYVFGQPRDDRAKVHHNLVPFAKLSLDDQLKDG